MNTFIPINKRIVAFISMSLESLLVGLNVVHAQKASNQQLAELREQWTEMNTSEPKQRALKRFNENKGRAD
ncbi:MULTISPECIES: hypothetical protein [unclassified Lentimonas]|uniref:hypothetical protein n=1 Tax=unclassified Lentimonas TaxID=2630993 RepID=UPI001324A1E4|nr:MULTISPECIES: hypothetical protein [unclassified Lentimonas]CAA6677782.1 Unannotated [Lentimonas sp. CC4]CAA6683884.1 Unannotated [Lentimonas sp. CC6]CAA6690024.1 Unannotated [Lentimonas sp. CC10]CAA6691100.1 Unannotated [Lentimonas sp. CC19]CAA7069287.1 Unannotated [Lentimonas sp. CC11]